MSDHGVMVFEAGVYIIGIIFLLAGAFAVGAEWVMAYRQRQRRNKRLYGHGNVYSTRELE